MFSFIKKKLGWGSAQDEAQARAAQEQAEAPSTAHTPAPAAAPVVTPSSVAPAPAPAPVPAPAATERRSWLDKLRAGLRKTGSSIAQVFTGTQIDDALYEELEAALLMADAGVAATEFLLADLKRRVKETKATDPAQVKGLLVEAITELLQPLEKGLEVGAHTPTVIMVAGVNGAGKTTTIGKLAAKFAGEGRKVMLAAGDTFRAAAIEQLKIWGGRTGSKVIAGAQGGDAASLAFEAVTAAKNDGADVLIVDTAGRLQNRAELMSELEKVVRVIKKVDASAPHAVLLVLDATVGQNALSQVEVFGKTAGVTGLVMTKLDGTARGGILVAIAEKFKLPIHFIGVGEGVDDLQPFKADEFAKAIAGIE